MSAHRKKISKDKWGFIERFGRDPRRLQLLFLSDANKSCWQIPQPVGNRATPPPLESFKNIFSC